MKNTKLVLCESSEFSCPTCGQTVFRMSAPKVSPCTHLRYAGCSEAPGMPEYVSDCLEYLELSNIDEQINVQMIDDAMNGCSEVFELDDEYGYITFYFAFAKADR